MSLLCIVKIVWLRSLDSPLKLVGFYLLKQQNKIGISPCPIWFRSAAAFKKVCHRSVIRAEIISSTEITSNFSKIPRKSLNKMG